MASLTKNGDRWNIRFIGPDNKRRWLRLGEVSKRDAVSAKGHVEAIVSSLVVGAPPPDDTARWLAKLGDGFHKKLAAVGLTPARGKATLGAFTAEYIAGRNDLKLRSVQGLQKARQCLVEYFGEHRAMRDIAAGETDDFRRSLASRYSDATIRRLCGRAKQFFRVALRKRLIPENPFADMKGCGVQANRERDYFLTREDAEKVIKACPDAEWRLIFALSRYGGLRCPSEHLALTWGDIDWERGRMLVRSPKTEHHEGKGERWVPLFPELRVHLEAAFDEAPEGSTHCINRYRSVEQNLRTQFQRIIHRAGLTAWPKLFHNLRASRATELAAEHPAHVAAAWLGHSALVAHKHYWQVTDADFDKAVHYGPSVGQNPGHPVLEIGGNPSQAETQGNRSQVAHNWG